MLGERDENKSKRRSPSYHEVQLFFMMRAGDTALSDITILTHCGEWRKGYRDREDRDGDGDLMMRTMRGGGLRIEIYVLCPLRTPAH